MRGNSFRAGSLEMSHAFSDFLESGIDLIRYKDKVVS